MIKLDITEIEKITDLLVRAASDTEEVASRLKQVLYEMQEDAVLAAYGTSASALEAVTAATEKLKRGNDSLHSLKSIMHSVAGMYQENEQRNIAVLNRMNTALECAAVSLQAAMTSDRFVYVEHSDAVSVQNVIQDVCMESKDEILTANLAAVSKIVNEEYAVTEVRELEKEV